MATTVGVLELPIRTQGFGQALRELSGLDAQAAKTGRTVTGLGSAFRGIGTFVGIGSAVVALRASATAADAVEASQRKLLATAKITGVALGDITKVAKQGEDQFKLSAKQSADFTANLVRLTTQAGDVAKTGRLYTAFLDLAATRGLSAADAAQALETTLLGQDEGLNRLGLANPQQIYERWARGAGVAAAKMTDAQKAQAVVTALLETGAKVAGEYEHRLTTTAGAAQVFGAETQKAAAEVGKLIAPARQAGYEIGTRLVQGVAGLAKYLQANGPLVAGIAATTTTVLGLGASVVALNKVLAISSGTALPGWLAGLARVGKFFTSPVGLGILAVAGAVGVLAYAHRQAEEPARRYAAALEAAMATLDPDEAARRLAAVEAARARVLAALRATANKPGDDAATVEANNRRNAALSQELTLLTQQATALRAVAGAKREAADAGGGAGADPEAEKARIKAQNEEVQALITVSELRRIEVGDVRRATALDAQMAAELARGNVTLARRAELLQNIADLRESGLVGMQTSVSASDFTLTALPRSLPEVLPGFEDVAAQVDAFRTRVEDEATDAADGLGATMRAQFATSIGDGIADGIAAGFAAAVSGGGIGAGFRALAGALIGGLGRALIDFGKQALLASNVMKEFLGKLANLLPGGAAAHALAMIALGGVMVGLGSAAAGAFGGGRGGSAYGGLGSAVSAPSAYPAVALGSGVSPYARTAGSASASPTATVPTYATVVPPQPVNVHATIIGADDPRAGRQVVELINNAMRRGGLSIG